MKKNIKFISLIITAILLVGAVIGINVSAEEADTTPGVRIAGQNLAYESAVQILYLVETKNAEGYTPKLLISDKAFEVNGAIPADVTVKECPTDKDGNPLTVTAKGKTYYAIFSDGIYPKDMRVALYATPVLVSEDGAVVAGKQTVYSPWQYSVNRFDAEPSAAQYALYSSMLDYAGAVQSVTMTPEAILAQGGYADAYYKINEYYSVSGEKTLIEATDWFRAVDATSFTAPETYAGKMFYKFDVADTENVFGYNYYPANLIPGTSNVVVKYMASQTVSYKTFDMEKAISDYSSSSEIIASSTKTTKGGSFSATGKSYYNIVTEEGTENSYLEVGRGSGDATEYYTSIASYPRNYNATANDDIRNYTLEFDFKLVEISKWGGSYKDTDTWPIRIYVGATSGNTTPVVLTILLYATLDSNCNVTALTYKSTSGNVTIPVNSGSSDWVHFKVETDSVSKTSTLTIDDTVLENLASPNHLTADFNGLDYVRIGYRGGSARYQYIRLGIDNVTSYAEAINPRGEFTEAGATTFDDGSQPDNISTNTNGYGYTEARLIGGNYAWEMAHDRGDSTSNAGSRGSGYYYADSDNMSAIYSRVDNYYASFDFMTIDGMYEATDPNGSKNNQFVFQIFFRNATGGEIFNLTGKVAEDKSHVTIGDVATLALGNWYHIVIKCDPSTLTNDKVVTMIINGVEYNNVKANINYPSNNNGTFKTLYFSTRAAAKSANIAVDNVKVGVEGKIRTVGDGKYASLAEGFENLTSLSYQTSGNNMTLNASGEAKNYMKLTDLTDTSGNVNRVLELGKTAGGQWAYATLKNNNKPAENVHGETHVIETDFMFNEVTPGSFASGSYVYIWKINSNALSDEIEVQFMLSADGTLYPVLGGKGVSVSSLKTIYLNPGEWYNIRVEVLERTSDNKVITYLYVNDVCVRAGTGIQSENTDISLDSISSEIRGGSSGTYVKSFNAYLDNLYIGTIAP